MAKDDSEEMRERRRKARRKSEREYRARNKEKVKLYHKAWLEKNKDKARKYYRDYHTRNKEKRNIAHAQYVANHPEAVKAYKQKHKKRHSDYIKEWRKQNPEKVQASRTKNAEKDKIVNAKWRASERGREIAKKWYREHFSKPQNRWRRLISHARTRASKRGLPFDDGLFDHIIELMPSHCRCCGIALDYNTTGRTGRTRDRAMSLDRFDSAGGYTIANCVVICVRCNFVKGNATLNELKMVVEYIERESESRQCPTDSDIK